MDFDPYFSESDSFVVAIDKKDKWNYLRFELSELKQNYEEKRRKILELGNGDFDNLCFSIAFSSERYIKAFDKNARYIDNASWRQLVLIAELMDLEKPFDSTFSNLIEEPKDEFISLEEIAEKINQVSAQLENAKKQLNYFTNKLGVKPFE